VHLTDEQRKEQLKAFVVGAVRDRLSRRDELLEMATTARAVWQGLLDAPTWSVAAIQQPDDWSEPEEIWSVTPTVVKK
jgi:hypothetical protein